MNLLPDEPTPAMLDAMRIGSRRDFPSDELCRIRYRALMACAKPVEPAPEPAPDGADQQRAFWKLKP